MFVCEVDESCGQATPPPIPDAAKVKTSSGHVVKVVVAKAPAKLSERDQLLKAWTDANVPSAKLAAAQAIVAFKKAKKKSWTALGIPTNVWMQAQEIVQKNEAQPAATPAIEAIAQTLPKDKPSNDDKVLKKPVKAKGKNTVAKGPRPTASKPQTSSAAIDRKAEAAATPVKEKKMTQQEEMAKLVELYNANPDKLNARAIYAFKQKSKKSWEVLGVTDVKFQKKITERAKL